MKQPPSLFERFTTRLKNNRIVAIFLVMGIVVMSLASFTDALTKLLSLLPDFRQVEVSGKWQSDALKDPRTHEEYSYLFDFKSDGNRLYGSALRVIPYCEKNKNAGKCAGYGRPVPILEGKLERKSISFLCDWGELPGAAPWTWVHIKETFSGVIKADEIRFVQQDDKNSLPVEFTATQG